MSVICFLVAASLLSPQTSAQGCDPRASSSSLASRILIGNLNQPFETALFEDTEELRKLYRLRVHAFYLNDDDSPNAFYTPQIFPRQLAAENSSPSDEPDGTMLLGLNLLKKEYAATQGRGLSIPAILGHEMAHALQQKQGFRTPGMYRELHADFMAGWFIGHRNRFRQGNWQDPIQSLFQNGDYMFNSPVHHGTPQQRTAAFTAGYRLNVEGNVANPMVAYNAGLRYLGLR